ncbi:protein FAM169B isoform X2 [Anarrhichthys ocellatus]|uniref:protein FAM169B isoform X2 n=1 Tax=Anarrhichthys ocellatus TaxID=433405 RepID=UPI0012EDCBA9|nr:protein FAM169B-like isoform X2 [Anarrhichthys ocellatus]
MYPVDLPAVVDTDLTSASEEYLSSLESRPDDNEWFQLSQTSKVAITANHVRRLQLFEDDQPDCPLLALHPPDDPTQVVALYLHETWWHVDDVLRTSSNSRIGLISVQSLMERVIVFLLSQVVERSSQEKVLFSLHPRTESCKLLWRDGQAVGFYTIKHKGSLCDGWSGRCYLLPALDTVLVRRSWRRRGLGLQMLADFCSSFSAEQFLGVSSPLSPSMVAVCRSFLLQHKEHLEHLYEVEAPGGWTQRRNIWLSIRLGRYSLEVEAKGESDRLSEEQLSLMVNKAELLKITDKHRPSGTWAFWYPESQMDQTEQDVRLKTRGNGPFICESVLTCYFYCLAAPTYLPLKTENSACASSTPLLHIKSRVFEPCLSLRLLI